MTHIEYEYDYFIKKIGDKLLKNCEEDEYHNIIVHTFEDLAINEKIVLQSEEEEYKILDLYERAEKENKSVIDAFIWVKEQFIKEQKWPLNTDIKRTLTDLFT